MTVPRQEEERNLTLIDNAIAKAISDIHFDDTSWSNLAKIVYRRTYSRLTSERYESYPNTVERVIRGNIQKVDKKFLWPNEAELLAYFMLNRKAMPAGRGLWYSGTSSHDRLGGAALCNCWFTISDDWNNFVMAMDLLMLGGGVGMSVEHRYTSKLPKIKKSVTIVHKGTKDADFIVPDSREGWCELVRRVFESYFVSGRSFSYSSVCVRGFGEPISGFGGVASGPLPLIRCVEKLCEILKSREGHHVRPIEAMDLLCSIGEMVVSGNVRRSALIILGDAWDKEYLKAKRWDLGPIPTQRAMANLSVVCDDIEDLHPLYWKTYEQGEAFGIINRKNIQSYGRIGEKKKDPAIGTNPCVPAGTQILTRKGYVPIETLVGNEIEAWNGFEWSKVVPKVTGHDQPLVTVHLSSGQTLTCTKSHKFVIALDYMGNQDRIEAGRLEEGMKLAKCDYPVISEGEKFEHAYAQGFVSGDGMDDYEFFYLYGEKIKCASRIGGRLGRYHEKQDKTSINLPFTPFLKSFVPMSWDLESRINWLAGLLDSDGTRTKEGGAQIGSVDRRFLLRVQKMLTITGVASKLNLMHEAGERLLPDGYGGEKPYPCQDCYRVLIGAVQIQRLKRLGLKCERLDLEATPQRDASRFVTVVDVEDAGIADTVYCFSESIRNQGCFEGVVTGQCAEACLEPNEPCNLQEEFLPNIRDEEEAVLGGRLMHRYGKRVTLETYHHADINEVVQRNRRIGTGITGCLQSRLFTPTILDNMYDAIQEENVSYSRLLGINESIRTTVVKPSGTLSLIGDCSPGIHPAYSKYYIRRVRFAANDKLIPFLREAGHPIEPVYKFDGSLDHGTLVADFYCRTPDGTPCADKDFNTWKQLETVLVAQRHWADQAVSCTVYYLREEIPKIRQWLADNLCNIKTISFLCYNDHGFKQAPLESMSPEQYQRSIEKIKPISLEVIENGELESMECSSGVCPIK